MTKGQWKSQWWELIKKVGEEPCQNVLGMDLIREELIENINVFNPFSLSVFGKEDFMQNMLHRVMGWDIDRKVPVIIFASNNQLELPEEVYKIFSEKIPEEAGYFFQYPIPRTGISPPFTFDNFFRTRRNEFLYVKLDPKGSSMGQRLLSLFEKEIKARFDATKLSLSRNEFPAIYILEPELFESNYQISKYVTRLKDHVTFRLFSKELSILGAEEASLIYGPGLYPKETYEKFRQVCYRHIDRKRKCAQGHCGLRDPENPEALASAIANSRIAMDITAFARFKTKYGLGCEYFWFYPAKVNLGEEACARSLKKINSLNNSLTASEGEAPPGEDPLKKVMNDLKPKK